MTRYRPRGLTTLLSLIALTGGTMVCAAQQPYGSGGQPMGGHAASPDVAVVTAMIKGDRAEVAYAHAALPALKDAEVKRLAQRLVDDHTAHETAITQIASRLQIPLPPAQTMTDPAPTNDGQFVAAVVSQHRELLSALPTDVGTIQDPELRNHVTETRKAVQMHLDEATRLQARMMGRAP